jgi:UDP-N-acetylglucosamine 2-epimerase
MTDITYEDYIAYLRKIVENYDKDMANQKLIVNNQQYEMASEYLSEEGLKAHYIVIDELGTIRGI